MKNERLKKTAKEEIEEKVEENLEEGQIKKKRISVFRSSLFNKTYATNLLVTNTDVDFRIELFNEKFETEKGWAYHSDGLVILTREAAKKLLITLDEKIKSYEKEKGEIKLNEERMDVEFLI